jgi:hypothetical protein
MIKAPGLRGHPGHTHGEHTFDLVKEAAEWKVDSDILHDLDSPPRHHHGGGGFDD